MKRLVLALLPIIILFTACGGRPATEVSPSPTPSSTPSPAPTTTPNATATTTPIPCDLATADYCVGEAYFVFQLPILPPGTDTVDRSYPFGSTEDGTREPHHGVEFYNASGTPVLAAADGTVYYAGNDDTRKFSTWLGLYGNIVVLAHPLTGTPFKMLYTLYAHLSKIDVSTGQAVSAGEKIGEVGMTGTASGSHLHFEVRTNPDDYNSNLNPELWLIPHPGNGALALLAKDATGADIYPSFNVQYYPDRSQPAAEAYQVDGYALEKNGPGTPWDEIAAIGDRTAGWYRITFLWAGGLYERWVEIQPGMLTRVLFTVK